MRLCFRTVSVLLCAVIVFMSVFVADVSATAATGRITGEGVNMRNKATTDNSTVITSLAKGTVVTINSKVTGGQQAVSGGGTVWYNVTYQGMTGYVYGKYIEEIIPATYDDDFEKNLLNFPESYREPLRTLHSVYPKWVFIADPVELSLDAAINLEYGGDNVTATRKRVELDYGEVWRDPRVDLKNPGHVDNDGWVIASRSAIAFFMDPRNALRVSGDKGSYPNIFTFMEQSYNASVQNESGLRSVIKDTFLEKGYGGDPDAYVTDIMNAAKQSGVSPYVIAATIKTEQGNNGTSGLISGMYSGYEGYYNFFNYGATGDNSIKNGLQYAKEKGWNSRAAAITGGAVLYGSGYIGRGQDTYYYMDFNVKDPKNIYHQYAVSVYDQCVKASGVKKAYVSNTDGALTFKIPVYLSMPDKVYAPPTASSGSTGEPSGEPAPTPVPARKKGDFDGDGKVTVKELAIIRMYLLGLQKLTVQEISYLDVSDDDKLTVKDLAVVRMYLLGLTSL